ncbi:hypothetical protein C1D09_004190 [Mesorhizobium intechi]|uniref:Uncharacterized protein n=1 Tax=Mesorhizobium intechi TaxID=537601 RepID=A0A8T9AX60_9HYPH|nr:hypothetical protein [Mesorhizobium intechi]TSE13390.1 hypothetical protein C1D09_004190 [Mesorhizobium intechi]
MPPKTMSRFWDNGMHKQKSPGETAQSDFAGLAQPNRFKSASVWLDSLPVRRYEAADPSSAFQLPGREK